MTTYEVLVVVFAGLTALATSLSAFHAWRIQRGQLTFETNLEWEGQIYGPQIGKLRLSCHNGKTTTQHLLSAEVVRPKMIRFGPSMPGPDFGVYRTPFPRTSVAPAGSWGIVLDFEPDWASWSERISTSPRYRFGRLLGERFPAVCAIIRVYVRDATSISAPRRRTIRVRIRVDSIMQNAAKAKNMGATG